MAMTKWIPTTDPADRNRENQAMNNDETVPARRWLCAIGLHKYIVRELHAEEPVQRGRPEMLMSVLEKCSCGHARIAPSGRRMMTRTGLFVPSKYMPSEGA